MIIRFFTRLYTNIILFKSSTKSITKPHQGDSRSLRGVKDSYVARQITFLQKSDDLIEPAKKEQVTVKILDFFHRFFTRFYPKIKLYNHTNSIIKPRQEDSLCFQRDETSIAHPITFVEKTDDPLQPAKEEPATVKMPGFAHPETIKEEGYFTQKAKQQLEELKRKTAENPALTNPEKKH